VRSAAALDAGALRNLVDEAVAEGLSRKDAVVRVAATTGLPRRTVYDAAHD
jgi:16S rRNA (cytidine1402-2'-O)-methyltransferase